MRSGFVAIIGRPNVGKSTLMNALVGEKIAITADKPQTTRNRIRGIYTDESYQIIFIDTPGVTKARNKLGDFMANAAISTLNETDLIVMITDEALGERGGDRYLLERIKESSTPSILIINKTDLIKPESFAAVYESWSREERFTAVVGCQAVNGKGVSEILSEIKKHMDSGPTYFPPDMSTDHPERFIVCEIIREKLLHYLDDEVPHGVAVDIESYEELPRLTKISAVIYTEKKSHKGIIIGKNGRKLKGIGKAAREEIEALTGAKVYLELWVKIKENWRDDGYMLAQLGYRDK